jgi:hypothetical protein
MSATAIVSVEDYLRRTEKPYCEYVDGVLYSKGYPNKSHAWGVPFCWVIDPEKQSGWQYHAGSEPERVDRGGTLLAGDLSVPLAELFIDKT